MIIITNPKNPAVLKILIAGKCAGKDIEVKIMNSQDSLVGTRLLPYLKLDGLECIFLPNPAGKYLFPIKKDDAKLEEWLSWESSTLTPLLAQFSSIIKNEKKKGLLVNYLKYLNDNLTQKYLCGEDLLFCDISIWSVLYPLFKDQSLSGEYFGEFKNLLNWFKEIEQESFVKSILEKYTINPAIEAYNALGEGARYITNNLPELSTQSSLENDDVASKQELDNAKKSFLEGTVRFVEPRNDKNPILPIPGEKNILITSALPYVNNVPHLGNIIGCVLSADVFARFCRLCNYNTLYICGTDEYGTATETKALEEGLTPQQICDKYFEIHNSVYRWFNIGFDYFGRTTTPEQTEIVQDLFHAVNKNGFVLTQSVDQLLCEKCNRYLADRFVEGGCPHPGCNYEDARGDQCDGCGKLINAVELKNPRCKVCKGTPVLRSSNQFFLDLPKLEPLLLHWIEKSSSGWSNNARVIAKSWMKEGLKPRCITRDLKWGVPVPIDGFRDKVFYVWFDAPIGYISMTQRYCKDYEKWWRPNSDTKVTLYQFMGKDNVPFHSVMFPGMLLGANRNFELVSHIMATEYVNYEDGKFSKSRGVGVFGTDAQQTGISSDVWRFYLLYIRPEGQDSNFSWVDLATKCNSELLNNFGNFVNRALVFTEKFFKSSIPNLKPTDDDFNLLALCNREIKGYISALNQGRLRDGIRYILNISRHGNQYLQSKQPWVLLKGTDEQKEQAGTVIGLCCNITLMLTSLLFPYMPDTSRTILKQLNAENLQPMINPNKPEIVVYLKPGHKIGKPVPLFTKLESEKIDELKLKFAGKQQSPQKEIINNDVAKKVENNNSGLQLSNEESIKELTQKIETQGALVRKLKESGAPKADWQPQVEILLKLKGQLSVMTGTPPAAPGKGKKGKK
nr:methionine--tRNA ligase, cytoplasmic [Onthophagus taurus]